MTALRAEFCVRTGGPATKNGYSAYFSGKWHWVTSPIEEK